MFRTQNQAISVLITVAFLATGTAFAAVVCKDTAALTAEAQQIVIGDVVSVTSFWNDDHTLIKSRVVVRVAQYLVGDGAGTEVLEMSGGTVDEVTLRVSVLPVFEVGDHVLLFLGPSEIRLVESFQGAYLTDGLQVARMGPACVRVIEDTLQPLTRLLDEIQGALPPGVTLPKLLPYEGDFRLPIAERYALCGADWTYQANPMGEPYKINANCVDASAGDPNSQRQQIQNGPAAWNAAGADFVFTYGGDSTQTAVAYNGTNLVYFDTTPPDGGGYVAATYYWASGGNISECDLVFNDQSYTWWNGSGSCGGNKMDIWNVATHETGHWLCLADLYGGGDTQKTMYGYVNYCETLKRTLHSDDIAGIIAIYGAAQPPDTTPPTPDPMTWATAPAPTSTSAVTMIGTTATDTQSPPVQYFFHFVSGGSGGNDSPAWQASTTYNDTGLEANMDYTYQVKARDSAATPNETQYSTSATTATYIETPAGVSFGTVDPNSIVLNATGTLSYLTAGSSGVYFDSTTPGGDGGINEWVQVTTDTATGLIPNSLYTFRVKAGNRNMVETVYSPNASQATYIETPTGVAFGSVTNNSIVLQATGTLTNLTVNSSGVYFDSTTPGGNGGINQWIQVTTDTATDLSPNTQYTFHVKARNRDGIETNYSPSANQYTLANVPGAPTLSGIASTTMNLDVNPNGNPASTQFAVRCAATADATWNGKYVDAAGNPVAGAVWRTDGQWGNIAVQGLDPSTQYCFDVKGRNADLIETAFSSQSCATTTSGILRGDMNCDGAVNFTDINPFVQALTDPAGWQTAHPGCNLMNADINQDGTVGFGDINPFVTCVTLSGCP